MREWVEYSGLRHMLLALCALCASVGAYAQPNFMVDPAQRVANNGDVVCLDMVVDDFTDLLTVDFHIAFDSTVLRFTQVNNVALPGMQAGDLTLVGPGRGLLHFDWTAPGASGGVGVDFPDFQPIFQFCFEVVGAYGESSPVAIARAPAPRVTRQNSGNRNIGLFQEDGLVAVGVLPLSLEIASASAAEGSSVCLDVTADNHRQLTSYQYTHAWDASVLNFTGVQNVNPALSQLTAASFTMVSPGRLSLDYPAVGPAAGPVTLPDGSRLYQLCFDVVGECDESTAVEVTGAPTPIEVYNSQSSQPLGLISTPGQFDVFACTGGLRVLGEVRTASPGDVVCVPFTVRGFQLVSDLRFGVSWNAAELEFVNAQVSGVGLPMGFTVGNINVATAPAGSVTVDWSGPASSVSNGRTLFELCFRVLAPAGTTAEITPQAVGATVIQNGTNIGLTSRDGEVVILSNTQLQVDIGGGTVPRGTELCVDFTVAQFMDLQTVRFSINWSQAVLRFNRFENFALPNIQPTTFQDGPGYVEFDWWDFSGSTLPDGTVLFTLCFEVIGQPGACTDLDLSSSPRAIFIEAASTRGYNSGLSWNEGELCAQDDRLFRLEPEAVTGSSAAPVCSPMRVYGLSDLRSAAFSLAWDPSRFAYAEIRNDVTGALSPDISETASGRVGVEIANAAQPLDLAYPDGTVLFELCLSPLSLADACTPIIEEVRPVTNTAQATDGFVGRVDVRMAELCAEAGLEVTAAVIDASCSTGSDGVITLDVSGSSGGYTFAWTNVPPSSATRQNQAGLPPGTYAVTVVDNANPANTETLTLAVGFRELTPDAAAGPDLAFACDAPATFDLDGSGSTTEATTRPFWRALSTDGQVGMGASSLIAQGGGTGAFELQLNSASGACTDRDTLLVTRPITPDITVAEQGDIDCQGTPATLRVEVAPTGDYAYAWSTSDGAFGAGATDEATVVVTAGGSYQLTVRDRASGCEVQSSIAVAEVTGNVVADAGDNQALTCAQTRVQLGGSATSSGADYELQWSTPSGAIDGATNGPTATATQPGTYYLDALQLSTGCTARDSVLVTSATGLPNADAGDAATLTCITTEYTLQGSGSEGADYTVTWTTADGLLEAGTESRYDAVALAPGTYVLTVVETASGCATSSSVTLPQNVQEPASTLASSYDLGCDADLTLLDPSYATDSLGYRFAWVDAAGDTVARTASLREVSTQTYTLVIVNEASGCARQTETTVTATTAPQVAVSAAETEFICGRDSIVLDAGASQGTSASTTLSWLGPQPQADASDPLVFYATSAGAYTAILRDATSGCADTLDVSIVLDDARTILSVDAGDDLTLACGQQRVDASAQAPTQSGVTLRWTSLDGNPVLEPTALAGGFSESGTYVLTFTDPNSACTGRDTLRVTRQTSDDLAVDAGVDVTLDCQTTAATLTAIPTTPDGDVEYRWRNLDNVALVLPPTSTVTATQAGRYVVELTFEPTGCATTDTVLVERIGQSFVVSAEPTQALDCGETDGPLVATVTGSGDYAFVWRALTGALTGPTDAPETSAQIGQYELIVTDIDSGCADSVRVLLEGGGDLPPASVEQVSDACSTAVTLLAADVPGAVGTWSVDGAAEVLDSLSGVLVLDGDIGTTVTVTYTLSSSDCPDYSLDVSAVIFATRSVALDGERFELPAFAADTTFDVASNDPSVGTVRYSVLDAPAFVTLGDDGALDVLGGEAGETYEVTYLACDTLCTDACAEATATLVFAETPAPPIVPERPKTIPNAITPNGDGLNDYFVFDEIVERPQDYPEARLTVFNRWGDVLYQAQPYQNEWGGQNQNGKPVPQGTYYYVLELDLQNQEIVKGHVTVLR